MGPSRMYVRFEGRLVGKAKSVILLTGWMGWQRSKRTYDAFTSKSENLRLFFLFCEKKCFLKICKIFRKQISKKPLYVRTEVGGWVGGWLGGWVVGLCQSVLARTGLVGW